MRLPEVVIFISPRSWARFGQEQGENTVHYSWNGYNYAAAYIELDDIALGILKAWKADIIIVMCKRIRQTPG